LRRTFRGLGPWSGPSAADRHDTDTCGQPRGNRAMEATKGADNEVLPPALSHARARCSRRFPRARRLGRPAPGGSGSPSPHPPPAAAAAAARAARRGAGRGPAHAGSTATGRRERGSAGRGAGASARGVGQDARGAPRGRGAADAPRRKPRRGGGGARARPRAGPVPPCRAARGRTARDSGQGAWRERAWREGAAGPRAGQQARPPLNIPSGVRSLFVPVDASGAPAPKIATPPPPRPPPPASARRRGARSRSQARWSAPLERGRPPGRSPARTRPRPRAPGERPSGRGPRALARASEGAPHAPRTCRHAAPRKLARARRAACINLEAAPRMPWPPSGDPRGTPWARPAPRCARVRSTRGPPGRSPRRWRGGAAAGGDLPAPRRAEGAMAAYLAASSPPLPPSPP